MGDFPEADWRILRDLAKVALDRFCKRVLEEACELTDDAGGKRGSCHDRYLALFRLLKERDRELAGAFNGLRRSTAMIQLLSIWRLQLLTDEELRRFSQGIRDRIARWDS